MDDVASERGRRVIERIIEAGRALGLEVRTEFPVVGGRVDVVWLWSGPSAFPVELPLVGFEVESSWRTRKHLKGDYLNLIDLQPSLGIIVLLGDDAKAEATREFTRVMLDRHPGRIELWAEADIRKLIVRSAVGDLLAETQASMTQPEESSVRSVRHVGKYRALAQWLAAQRAASRRVSFGEIEEVLGFPLPPSSFRYVQHWHGYEGSAVARSIHDAGWRATQVDLEAQMVTLEKL